VIEVVDDPAEAVADLLVRADGDIVITGGSSPRRAYELAAERRADWSGVTVWFTDERCVPPDHEGSNFAMADAALFSRLAQPPRIMRMQGELGPEEGAATYAAALGDDPQFGLMLLGLGPDGHTASLFPGKPEIEERGRLVVGVPLAGMEPQVPRVSLTLPALYAARAVVFLLTGAGKADIVARVFGPSPDTSLPAALVRPRFGSLTVILDEAAAAKL